MALLRYLTKGKSTLPDKSTCPSLTRKEVDSANECVKDSLQQFSHDFSAPLNLEVQGTFNPLWGRSAE